MASPKPMSTARARFFPIHNHELKKFIPLSLIFFCISYNYSLLRNLKDAMVLGIEGSGAAAISAAKLWGVIPGVILFKIFYDWTSKHVGRTSLFNIVTLYFMSFFTVFVWAILPYKDDLVLLGFQKTMTEYAPWFKRMWLIFAYWPYTLFYIHAEMWGTYMLSVGFWTFVNAITGVEQSKRFYSFLMIGANVGTIFAGLSSLYSEELGFDTPERLPILVLLGGVIILALYNPFARAVERDPVGYSVEAKPRKKKAKLSPWQSLVFLSRSPYLARTGAIVLSYTLGISLLEAYYRDFLKVYVSRAYAHESIITQQKIITYFGAIQLIAIGTLSVLTTVFISSYVMKRGWRFAASLSPFAFVLLTSFLFTLIFFKDYAGFISDWLQIEPDMLIIGVAMSCIILIKTGKYTFFDPTKEATYIPLDEESKIRGKSAVDGVGSRFGKGLGSVVIITIIEPFLGGTLNATWLLAFLIFLIGMLWLFSVQDLSVRFEALTLQRQKEAQASNASPTTGATPPASRKGSTAKRSASKASSATTTSSAKPRKTSRTKSKSAPKKA